MEIKNANELREIVKEYEETINEKMIAIEKIVYSLIENKLVPLAKLGKKNTLIYGKKYRSEIMQKFREYGYVVMPNDNKSFYVGWY